MESSNTGSGRFSRRGAPEKSNTARSPSRRSAASKVLPDFGDTKPWISAVFPSESSICALRAEIAKNGLNVDVQADGGINDATIRDVLDAGVNVIVAGSSVFGVSDAKAAIDAMRALQ